MRKQWQRSPLKVKELIIIHQSPHDFLSKCKTMFFVWISSVCYYSCKPLDLLTFVFNLDNTCTRLAKKSTDRVYNVTVSPFLDFLLSSIFNKFQLKTLKPMVTLSPPGDSVLSGGVIAVIIVSCENQFRYKLMQFNLIISVLQSLILVKTNKNKKNPKTM